MNLSLIIVVILVAVVLPWFFRRIFLKVETDETPRLEPILSEEIALDNDTLVSEKKETEHLDQPYFSLFDERAALVSSSLSEIPISKTVKKSVFFSETLRALHILAPEGYVFVGYELWQVLQSAGLNYGEKQLFHYYSDNFTHHQVLFSVASTVEPGTFDLQNIGVYSTPGLILFMEAAVFSDPDAVYDLMLQIAHQLSEDLGGRVVMHEY